MYAVLETGSKQYRVAAGDTLEIERLDVAAGEPFTFDRVLLVNNDGKLTVLENLQCHAALYGVGGAEGRTRAAHLLERLGVADRARDLVETLSGGVNWDTPCPRLKM
jgi:ribosomal protein L21